MEPERSEHNTMDPTRRRTHHKATLVALAAVCLAAGLGADLAQGQRVRGVDNGLPYNMKWIGTPTITREHGEPKQVSSVVVTGDEANHVVVAKEFSHTFSIKKGLEVDLAHLIKSIGVELHLHVSQGVGNKTSLHHKISMERRSKGVVWFTENLIRIEGKARKTFAYNVWCAILFKPDEECFKDPEDIEIDVTSTETDEFGHAMGTFRVKYIGTDEFRHPEFYNMVNRTAETRGAFLVEGDVKSPFHCAERAILSNRTVAQYDVDMMRCYLYDRFPKNGTVLDRAGFSLGARDYRLEAQRTSTTSDPDEKEDWVTERRCDIIHEYTTPKKQVKYLCRRYEVKSGFVLMMRRKLNQFERSVDSETPTNNDPEKKEPRERERPRGDDDHEPIVHGHGNRGKPGRGRDDERDRDRPTRRPYDDDREDDPRDEREDRDNRSRPRNPHGHRNGEEPDQTNYGRDNDGYDPDSRRPTRPRPTKEREVSGEPEPFDPEASGREPNGRERGQGGNQSRYAGGEKESKPYDGKPGGARGTKNRTLHARDKHPKFHHLIDRTITPSVGAQTVRNIKSAYECGEQAIGSEKFMAIYRPKQRTCVLEPVLWNFGRAFTAQGKPLGPYGMRSNDNEQQTDEGETRQNWFNEAECDLVHDTDEGVYSCKMFDHGKNTILMFRYVDGYEAKRINRAYRSRENDRLLYSESKHPNFYAIKDRDFPIRCSKTKQGVKSAQACGDLAIEEEKNLAVFKPTSQSCILKEIHASDGLTLDRWNKPLGNYDIPFYDRESSELNTDYERWLDLNECDIIHSRDDGWRYCKQFPTTDDSILLFRRHADKKPEKLE